MTSKDESKASRKRAGRKRLPPLAPGPALQFVVASHPDDFKADDTMRNVRSHVMYKHRGEQHGRPRSPSVRSVGGRSSSRPMSMTRTPSPMTMRSEGMLEDNSFLAPTQHRSSIWGGDFHQLMSQSHLADPARNLATRIIAATTAEPARSAPPTFDCSPEFPFPGSASFDGESLDALRNLYIERSEMCPDRAWMETVCSTRMSFLSNVSVQCVYQDLSEGLLDESQITIYAKNKVVGMIKDSLQEASTSTDDFTALSILHLLVSEFGSSAEHAFNLHHTGLVDIVRQRGGLRNLGLDGRIAVLLTVIVLSFAIVRGQAEPPMLRDYVPSRRQSSLTERSPPLSPLFAPNGNLSALYGSCSTSTYEILCDMHDLTRMFILRWNYVTDGFPPQSNSELASYDAHMQQIYTRLLLRPSADAHTAPDWIYESCRLAALIYCRSIVQGVPLSDSANLMHAQSSDVTFSGATIITALYGALDNTDKSGGWGDMWGVLLWTCLVGGAASWPSPPHSIYGGHDESHTRAAWVKKYFALFAVKSCLACGFEQAAATVEAQRAMLQVQSLITLKSGIASQ